MAWDSTKSAPSAQQPEPSTQCPIPGGYRRAETRHHRIASRPAARGRAATRHDRRDPPSPLRTARNNRMPPTQSPLATAADGDLDQKRNQQRSQTEEKATQRRPKRLRSHLTEKPEPGNHGQNCRGHRRGPGPGPRASASRALARRLDGVLAWARPVAGAGRGDETRGNGAREVVCVSSIPTSLKLSWIDPFLEPQVVKLLRELDAGVAR
jgi:hypothetical protein